MFNFEEYYKEAHSGNKVDNSKVLEYVKTFEKVNGVEIPYKIVERRPGDVAECYADASKAEKILGWKAEKDIKEMCLDAYNFVKKG